MPKMKVEECGERTVQEDGDREAHAGGAFKQHKLRAQASQAAAPFA